MEELAAWKEVLTKDNIAGTNLDSHLKVLQFWS